MGKRKGTGDEASSDAVDKMATAVMETPATSPQAVSASPIPRVQGGTSSSNAAPRDGAAGSDADDVEPAQGEKRARKRTVRYNCAMNIALLKEVRHEGKPELVLLENQIITACRLQMQRRTR
jgi:hypothetical protein